MHNFFVTQHMKRKYLYIFIFIAIGCIVSGAIFKTSLSQTPSQTETPTIVRTRTIQTSTSKQGYIYSGEVCGRYESQLAFQVSGKIIKRNVQLGSMVNADDILMQIDGKDIQQTVTSNSAQVNSAKSQLTLAESNLNRYQQLLYCGAVSQAQYDQYVNAYNAAAATVEQATAQYTQGANQLDYTLLKTDHTGVVSAITAEVGQVVSAGQTVITVVQDGSQEIEINVPENRIENLKNAEKINITFWALPDVKLEGKVREIAPMADNVTRTFKVRISILNPPPSVKLGMTATVDLSNNDDSESEFTIPLSALYQTGDTPAVWVVMDDTLTLRPIKVGLIGKENVQVLEGLKEGDQIVVSGVHKLTEGQRVNTTGDAL